MATLKTTSLGFSQAIENSSQRILAQLNDKLYQICKELFTSIVNLSPSPANPGPWAKGVLSNNWYPMNGAGFSSEKTESRSYNGAGSLTRINALQGTQFKGKDGVVTLSNNQDYAYRAEVLGWPAPEWSGKSGGDKKGGPYRMVARSLQIIAARYR